MMQPSCQSPLDLARLLAANHWLSHAQAKCKEIVSSGDGAAVEALDLLSDVDSKLRDSSALNLSRDHAPVAILMEKSCIISTLHFRHLDDERLKREAFRQSVYYIDVETSSQCNRTCGYCPNSQNDRLSTNKFMPDSVFERFVGDLAQIDYEKDIHFVGYNEPLLYLENILGRIAMARKLVPRSNIVIFTNGDFLKQDVLEQIVAAGATEMVISVHLPNGRKYNDDEIFTRINKIAKRLSTPIVPIGYIKDAFINARLVHDRIAITIRQTDYEQHGSNRAGTLDAVGHQVDERTAACLMPIYQFILGYQGAVVPCCVMVSDDTRNAKSVIGRVDRSSSIFDIYTSSKFVAWRRGLFNLSPKQGPCKTCNWESASPLLNSPAVYDPWQHLVSPSLVQPVLIS